MRSRRVLTLLLVLALTLAATPRGAGADADPPSDILLGTPVYFPYQPAVSAQLQRALSSAVAQLARHGFDLKVAIIATKIDLGAIPGLFGKPQTYADFLDQEISLNGPQPLLVVAPAGFGIVHAGAPGVLGSLPVSSAGGANGLARSAILAVQRIARARGIAVSVSTSPAAGGSSTALTIGLPVLAVLLVLTAGSVLRRRRQGAPGPPGPTIRGRG
jgi:hypothetical protein